LQVFQIESIEWFPFKTCIDILNAVRGHYLWQTEEIVAWKIKVRFDNEIEDFS